MDYWYQCWQNSPWIFPAGATQRDFRCCWKKPTWHRTLENGGLSGCFSTFVGNPKLSGSQWTHCDHPLFQEHPNFKPLHDYSSHPYFSIFQIIWKLWSTKSWIILVVPSMAILFGSFRGQLPLAQYVDVFRTFATARGCGAALLNVVRPCRLAVSLGRNPWVFRPQLWGHRGFPVKKKVNQMDDGSCGCSYHQLMVSLLLINSKIKWKRCFAPTHTPYTPAKLR